MKRHLLTFLLLAATLLAAAAEAQFSVIPPRRVAEGEKFAVTFRLDNAEGSGLQVAQINGCTLLFGPSQSTSRSYSIVNGRQESSSRQEYTYTYRADRAGEFTIPPATVMADGRKLTTKAVKFTVLPASAASQPAQSRPSSAYDPDTQQAGRKVDASDVFVRIILAKSSVWEQEAVECTIKLYTTYSINEFFVTRQPEFEGCLIQEVDNQAALNREETLNGRTYMTAVLKRCILFPQRPGKLTINSGNYDVSVVQYENVSMGGFFTVRQPVERKIKITSNQGALSVKALPEPRPDGFFGAVGTFSVDSRLVGSNFRTNEPGSLLYTIKGTGNIKYLKEPEIDFPAEFELYSPQADIDTRVAGSNVTGTMTVDYTFVPQTTGQFHIGGDTFVYFDPSKGEYVTLHTPGYDIKVAKGTTTAASADQEAISAKNSDILHILQPGRAPGGQTLIIERGWYWLMWAGAAALFIAALLVWRGRMRRAADVAGTRLAKAGRTARKRLAKARQALEAGRPEQMTEETLRALNGYLGDKLGIATSELSAPVIEERLRSLGADNEVVDQTLQVLDTCAMARYTPMGAESMKPLFESAQKAIQSIENLKATRR